jgi:transposase
MAPPCSVDLRVRGARRRGGLSRWAATAKFEVSVSFVVKLIQRWRERGTLQPQRIGGGKLPISRPTARGSMRSWRPSGT